MFEPKIIKVANNVYTAIGYQVTANSMIVGDDGVIIVDPGQMPLMASRVRKAFEEITDKPVKAIIYTTPMVTMSTEPPRFTRKARAFKFGLAPITVQKPLEMLLPDSLEESVHRTLKDLT